MSAQEFVNWYMNLSIGNGEWTTSTVSLNKYMIGADFSSPKAAARNAVLNAATNKKLGPDKNAFQRASNGKVSPSDCEHILNLAVDTGIVKPEGTQAWADKCLGLDCTGFAVAYYDSIGIINIDRYNTGASCGTLLGKAKYNKLRNDATALIWELDQVEVDDMILWMNEGQVETRVPGHIAVVYDIDSQHNMLYTAESNGANDGDGHYGPKLTERTWVGRTFDRGSRCIQLGKSDKVIIVRPPPNFG